MIFQKERFSYEGWQRISKKQKLAEFFSFNKGELQDNYDIKTFMKTKIQINFENLK